MTYLDDQFKFVRHLLIVPYSFFAEMGTLLLQKNFDVKEAISKTVSVKGSRMKISIHT